MDIPAFKKGMALMASDLNRLANQVRASRITSVIGGKLDVTPGGTSITVTPQSNLAASNSTPTPWQVMGAAPQEGQEAPRLQVYLESELIEDPRGELALFDTGSFDPFTFPELNSAVFIKVEFDEDMKPIWYIVDHAVIPYGMWPDYPDPVVRDDTATGVNYKRQKYLFIALAEVVTPDDGREGTIYTIGEEQRKVVQLVNTNLCLQWTVLAGMSARIAVPWFGPNRLTS